MSAAADAAVAAATDQRLSAALTALGHPAEGGSAARLGRLVDAARGDAAAVWLLIVAVCGAYPRQDEVLAVRRVLDLLEGPAAIRAV
ncbi:MAG: hypothetical protein LDL15_05480, partial [Yonghaparkia sp.]|nr:hypothetical protein [Microcella sp.]